MHLPKNDWQQMACCRRFDECRASVCPLDSAWRLRVHRKGESVCHWLRCLVKPGGRAILRGSVPEKAAEAIAEAYPAIIARHAPIRRALERASRSPVKAFQNMKSEVTA